MPIESILYKMPSILPKDDPSPSVKLRPSKLFAKNLKKFLLFAKNTTKDLSQADSGPCLGFKLFFSPIFSFKKPLVNRKKYLKKAFFLNF